VLLRPHQAFIRAEHGRLVEQTTSLVTNERQCSGINGATGAQNMFASDTPNSATEQKRAERLDVSHARAVQDADRVFTLCDIRGRLILRDDLRPKQDASEITS
jgi:hypothetical protein